MFEGKDPGLVLARAPVTWPPHDVADFHYGFDNVGPDIARGVIEAEYVFVVPRSVRVNELRLMGKHCARLNAKLPVSELREYRAPQDRRDRTDAFRWQKFPYLRDEGTDLSVLDHFVRIAPANKGAKLRVVTVSYETSTSVRNANPRYSAPPDGYEYAEVLCGVDYSLIDVNENRIEAWQDKIPAHEYAKVAGQGFHFLYAGQARLTDARGRSFVAGYMTARSMAERQGAEVFGPRDHLICRLTSDSDGIGHFCFASADGTGMVTSVGVIDVRQAHLPPVWLLYVFTIPEKSKLKSFQLYGQVVTFQ
ncbi:MAG: hypothetical protein JW955_22425 [Sedimentisphaerales bacterium]|nr:hypothetical protein [Sedimentisphaerales bacterium]